MGHKLISACALPKQTSCDFSNYLNGAAEEEEEEAEEAEEKHKQHFSLLLRRSWASSIDKINDKRKQEEADKLKLTLNRGVRK